MDLIAELINLNWSFHMPDGLRHWVEQDVVDPSSPGGWDLGTGLEC